MNKYAIISRKVPKICDKLSEFGYKLIYSETVDGFISYEQNHADMQCIAVDNKVFVLKECTKLGNELSKLGFNVAFTKKDANGSYPDNILLNAKIIGKTIIGKLNKLDKGLIDYCKNNGFSLSDTNQGYTACSILKVNDNSAITADESIYKSLKNCDIDVLKIREGHIKLCGAGENTYGFIGGASATLDNNNILFFGDIINHPDCNAIIDFCESRNVSVHSISDIELTDIGGAILLNN